MEEIDSLVYLLYGTRAEPVLKNANSQSWCLRVMRANRNTTP